MKTSTMQLPSEDGTEELLEYAKLMDITTEGKVRLLVVNGGGEASKQMLLNMCDQSQEHCLIDEKHFHSAPKSSSLVTLLHSRKDGLDFEYFDATNLYHRHENKKQNQQNSSNAKEEDKAMTDTNTCEDWMDSFCNVDAVLFFAELSDYDEALTLDEKSQVYKPTASAPPINNNRLKRAMEMLQAICTVLDTHSVILILNEKEAFAEKILLSDIVAQPPFPDYAGPPKNFDYGTLYFIEKFKSCCPRGEFDDFYIRISGTDDCDAASEFVLDCVRTIIMTDNLKRSGFLGNVDPDVDIELKVLTEINKRNIHKFRRKEDLVWSNQRDNLPEALEGKGVSLADWSSTWDAVQHQFWQDLCSAKRCRCRALYTMSRATSIAKALMESNAIWDELASTQNKKYKQFGTKVIVLHTVAEYGGLSGKEETDVVACGLGFKVKS